MGDMMSAEKIIYTNARGQSIELSNSRPFFLQSVEGKGDVGADIQTQKAPYQDGSSYIDTDLQPRSIVLTVTILTDDNESLIEQRQLLASVFNPKLGKGKLIYSKGNTEREIQAISENVPLFPTGKENNGFNYQRTIINLLCPSPFWEDILPTSNEMAVFVGVFEFPLEFIETGINFGEQGEKIVIHNRGDVKVPVKIEFNGPALNPKVTNLTTGEFILVNRSVGAEEKLVLTTDFGKKRVEIHKEDGTIENAFAWIDLNSTFWQLESGDNLIKYEADVGMDTARVFITYKNRYVSV